MDAKHHKLIQRLQEAVVDEHDGEQEYAETAEEAKRQNLKEIESMARSHQSDEARHGQENRAALHQLYLKE
jgi:rubrerythrin